MQSPLTRVSSCKYPERIDGTIAVVLHYKRHLPGTVPGAGLESPGAWACRQVCWVRCQLHFAGQVRAADGYNRHFLHRGQLLRSSSGSASRPTKVRKASKTSWKWLLRGMGMWGSLVGFCSFIWRGRESQVRLVAVS